MGQFWGMVLTDVGADAIKIEPSNSDNIPNLSSSRAGFFVWSNQNKKSVAIDLHTPVCSKATHKLIAAAGIVDKNSYPRAILKLGIACAIASKLDVQLICVI